MADFNVSYTLTLAIEGGYANDPNDRGGETWAGISRNNFPAWEGWKVIDSMKGQPNFPINLKGDIQLSAMVKVFYKTEFWDALMLDQVNDQRISNELYDIGVNMGKNTPVIFLQRVLNVSNKQATLWPDIVTDGVMGVKTLSLLNNHPRPLEVLKAVGCLQGAKYIQLCEANPKYERFYQSWMSRCLSY